VSRDSGLWRGTISIAEHLGSDTFLHIRADDIGPMTARVSGEMGLTHGETVFLSPAPDKVHKFSADGLTL
jgi:multiple sugar transport system ATP-binding protein